MANLYDYRAANIRRSYFLLMVFLLVVIGLGWVFSYLFNNQGILLFAIIFSVVSAFISYWSSDKIALTMARAMPIEKKDNPELYNTVENLTIASGLPMPRIYLTPEKQINAFATGRDPGHAAVAVTRGSLERLNKTELEGVLAHELSHVSNRDILVSTMAVVLAGTISLLSDIFLRSLWFGGFGGRNDERSDGGLFLLIGIVLSILAPIGAMLIQLAISRKREALADASGVLLTRYPQGLISALQKIAVDEVPMATAKDSTAHLWFDTPFKGRNVSWWHKLFMSHPPIEERIKALRQISV